MIYFLHVNKQFRIEDVSSDLNVNCFLGLGPNKVCTGALKLRKFLKLSLALVHLLLKCLRQKNSVTRLRQILFIFLRQMMIMSQNEAVQIDCVYF